MGNSEMIKLKPSQKVEAPFLKFLDPSSLQSTLFAILSMDSGYKWLVH